MEADAPVKSKAVTLRLVMEQSLTPEELAEYDKLNEEDALARAQALKTLHLEWQNIGEIDSLDLFEAAEVLYMQYNRIERIEGLDCLPRLQFLALQGNCIRAVENLLPLGMLEFLDLSKNEIQELGEEQLPPSVNMLNMRGNPCAQASDYRERVLRRLPGLLVFDGEELPQDDSAGGPVLPAAPRLARELEEEPDDQRAAFSSSQGLSAFHDRRAMQAESAASIAGKIQAYTEEMLADVDGLAQHLEGAVGRSRARRSQPPAEPRLKG